MGLGAILPLLALLRRRSIRSVPRTPGALPRRADEPSSRDARSRRRLWYRRSGTTDRQLRGREDRGRQQQRVPSGKGEEIYEEDGVGRAGRVREG